MRLYTQEDFQAEISKMGFFNTGETTATQTIWQDKKDSSRIIFVPKKDKIPDYILDTILGTHHEACEPTLAKEYQVEKKPDLKSIK